MTPTTANSPRCSLTRESTIEHPFGSIKQWLHPAVLPMRGLGDVRRELSLAPLTYNLWRALNILGIGP